MDLKRASHIAQESGRDAVRTIMAAIGRDNPWEITERYLQAAILTGFYKSVQDEPLKRRLRIRDEIVLEHLTNLSFPSPWDWPVERTHPLDLVIFEPLRENSPGSTDPWDPVNKNARGVIELKKYVAPNGPLRADCQCLGAIADAWLGASQEPPWVMLVVFVNGVDAAAVKRNVETIKKLAVESLLTLQAGVAPQSADMIPGSSERVRWFDIVCFGR